MRLLILIALSSLVFWSCSDNYSPSDPAEQYQNSFLIQEPCYVDITIAESVYYQPASVYVLLSNIIYEYDASERSVDIKLDNSSNGSSYYLNLKLNDNFYIGSCNNAKVYAKVIEIYADSWVTLSFGEL